MILRRLASTLSTPNAPYFKLPSTIKQVLALQTSHDALPVTVSGWIKSIRRQKNVTFAVVTDGSSAQDLQAVFIGNGEDVKALTNGAAVRLTGDLVSSPAAGQEKELRVDLKAGNLDGANVQILGTCDPEVYPIQKKALSTEYLRDHSHMRARTDTIAAMIRLRNDMKKGIGTFFDAQGFFYTHTPIITGNDAEGAGEAFRIAEISGSHPAASSSTAHPTSSSPSPSTPSPPHPHEKEFFSRPAYLTVSHQLHLEALAHSLSRVYTLSPCFRAERSLTGRHLAEFWMLEAEWASTSPAPTGGVAETCSVVEACIRAAVSGLLHNHASRDVDVLWKGGDEGKRQAMEDAVSGEKAWTRMSYTDAVKALEAHTSVTPEAFEYKPGWGRTLQSEHERWVAEVLVKGPVFITDYPASLKPFYMRANDTGGAEERQTVGCFDLIVPHVGELVGGSVREERADVLEGKMRESLGEDLSEYQWYLDLRRYGGAPHMGFGMGFERLVGWVGGVDNVRESIPFPRWAGRMLL